MTLQEFINQFVLRNTLIRLWTPTNEGHKMLHREENCVCMEWQITGDHDKRLGKVTWQKEYKDAKVIGVTDIVVDDFYREAINIVIDVE